jgi:hypothetical protein
LSSKVKFIFFFVGPLAVFILTITQSARYELWIFVPLSFLWIFLAWEDVNFLAVSLFKLITTCAITVLCSLLIIDSSEMIKPIIYQLVLIFIMVFLINKISGKSTMGSADLWAIGAMSFTISPGNIGLWIVMACALALIPYVIGKADKNKPIPFFPYLVVSWMLIFSFNVLQGPFL